MEPTLRDGQTVLVDPRAYTRSPPRAGEVVLAMHPIRPSLRILKRVRTAELGRVGDVRLDLRGDSPQSSCDSRTFGRVALNQIVGRVVAILSDG